MGEAAEMCLTTPAMRRQTLLPARPSAIHSRSSRDIFSPKAKATADTEGNRTFLRHGPQIEIVEGRFTIYDSRGWPR